MENRNLAIGITVATILICGLPGLVSVCVSPLIVIGRAYPDQPAFDWLIGISFLCGGLLLIAVPAIIGIFTLRRKKSVELEIASDEPIPPPS